MEVESLQNVQTVPRDIALKAVNLEPYIAWQKRQGVVREAAIKPLPGSAEQAFVSGPVMAAGKTVNRVVPAHFAVLQALKSPLLEMISNAVTKRKSEVDFTHEQQWEICHVFTAEPKALYRALRASGAEFVRQQAHDTVMEWDAAAINLVMLAVMEQMKRHISTTVKFAADMEKEGQVSFFRETPGSQ